MSIRITRGVSSLNASVFTPVFVSILWLAMATQSGSAGELAKAVASTGSGQTWAQWRGPYGTGHSNERDLPVSWNDDNVRWIAELGGRGQSSPIVWQDRIFLTIASQDGYDCAILAIDRKGGKELWKTPVRNETPEKLHSMNTWATPTCACDGEVVVASFGDGGLHCCDLSGKNLWSHDLGKFDRRGWGSGSSPVIVGDLVILTCDADNSAFMVAFNKTSGKEIWRTERPNNRSFSTPLLIDTGKRKELVVNGHAGIHAYNPANGELLWYCLGGTGRGTPTVVTGNGMVIVVSGRSGRDGDLMAIEPGGSGDVAKTHLKWSKKRGGRDLPSPIVVGDYLFIVNLRPGIATCYDVKSGEQLWQQRMGGSFSASPIAVDGLIYVLSEAGETTVIKPGKKYDEVARNRLPSEKDEIFRACLMPYDGRIYCRSDRRLFCIGKTGS